MARKGTKISWIIVAFLIIIIIISNLGHNFKQGWPFKNIREGATTAGISGVWNDNSVATEWEGIRFGNDLNFSPTQQACIDWTGIASGKTEVCTWPGFKPCKPGYKFFKYPYGHGNNRCSTASKLSETANSETYDPGECVNCTLPNGKLYVFGDIFESIKYAEYGVAPCRGKENLLYACCYCGGGIRKDKADWVSEEKWRTFLQSDKYGNLLHTQAQQLPGDSGWNIAVWGATVDLFQRGEQAKQQLLVANTKLGAALLEDEVDTFIEAWVPEPPGEDLQYLKSKSSSASAALSEINTVTIPTLDEIKEHVMASPALAARLAEIAEEEDKKKERERDDAAKRDPSKLEAAAKNRPHGLWPMLKLQWAGSPSTADSTE